MFFKKLLLVIYVVYTPLILHRYSIHSVLVMYANNNKLNSCLALD